ncbi:MAG: fused MFS/spermidine synthase [Solobacterium sp.]|jgi:spermidine synthase|nr:fused MFS/spermidine synthase [Solobacterium sp.]MCH4205111.1 fused MFS/spermidine synthase [Solobacterium sp.]MCH4226704.1 fused MFS/spermidine synthase [Solobacterium sp.]MCH4281967.1 fused MFS/spermidine synthase [Solobacterium sp.]
MILFQKKTPFGTLEVAEEKDRRVLLCNGHIESAVYLSAEKENELIFPYMQRFSYAFAVNPNIHRTLLIGGGAFAYPRYYLAHYPDCRIDVIEISEDILAIDQKYFSLDAIRNERMKIICEDGMHYLQKRADTYDLIINDAFVGSTETCRDLSAVQLIHRHLNEHGIYLVNAAVSVKGPFSTKFRHFDTILKKEFKAAAMMQCDEQRSLYEKQNILMIASDDSLL